MSNEELAIKAKGGDQNAVTELWGQVRRFAEMKAGQFWRKCSSIRTPNFELDDLVQSSFLALIKAIQYCDLEKGTFLTAFDFCLKGAFSEVAGIVHKTDAFLYATSLDAPINTDADASAVVDFIPDPCNEPENIVLQELYATQLHEKLEAALSTLPDDQNEVLHRRYYDGDTCARIAADHNCTGSNIQRKEKLALKHLHDRSRILGLDDFIDAHTDFFRKVGIKEFKTTHESAVEKIVFKRDEQRKHLARKWLRQQEKRKNDCE